MTNCTIYKQAGLTAEEAGKMPRYMAGIEEFYASEAFNKLYEYFFNKGLMPYEVAKARTECPEDWILDTLTGFDAA
tara:strand:+ start:180 stop:407 length:228 start_codon:yes stop_codon:yes gene_type:complete